MGQTGALMIVSLYHAPPLRLHGCRDTQAYSHDLATSVLLLFLFLQQQVTVTMDAVKTITPRGGKCEHTLLEVQGKTIPGSTVQIIFGCSGIRLAGRPLKTAHGVRETI